MRKGTIRGVNLKTALVKRKGVLMLVKRNINISEQK
jgi:hypothetical protein